MPIDLNTLGSETENDKVVASALAGARVQPVPASQETVQSIANVGVTRIGEAPVVAPNDRVEVSPDGDDVGFFDGVAAGALDNGFISGGLKAVAAFNAADDVGIDRTVDYSFAPSDFYERDPEAKSRLDSMRESATGSGMHYWQQFHDAPNEQVARYVLSKWDEHQATRKQVEDADLIPYSLGLMGSLAADTVAAVLSGAVGGVGRATLMAETIAGSRVRAGARVAGFGAIEGAGERAAQGITNKDIELQDLLIAAGFGATAGGLLGGLAPRFVGNVGSKQAEAAALLRHANEVKAMRAAASGDGMGAATTLTDDGANVLTNVKKTSGTGSTVVGKVLPGWIRSPKRWAMDMAIKGAEYKDRLGLLGRDRFGAIMERTYKRSTLAQTDLEGIASQDTIQMALRMDEEAVISLNQKQHDIYTKFVRNIMGKGAGAQAVTNDYLLSNTIGRVSKTNIPSKEEMRNYAALISQARGESVGPSQDMADVLAHVENKLRGRVADDKLADTMAMIEQMGKLDDQFFEAWGLREIQSGLLDAEDLKPGYRPQVWNTEAIESDPVAFENLIAERMGLEVRDDWVNTHFQREMTAEEKAAYDEANPNRAKRSVPGSAAAGTAATKVVDYPQVPLLQGSTIGKLRDNDPDLYQAVLDEWDEGRIAENAQRLEAASEVVEKELKRFRGQQIHEIFGKWGAIVRRSERTIQLGQRRLDELAAGGTELEGAALQLEINKVNTRISRANARRAEVDRRHFELQKAIDTQENLTQIVRQNIKGRGIKKDLDKLVKKHMKSERRLAANNARELITKAARDVKDKLLNGEGPNGKAPGGFVTDDLIQSSKYFKRRNINLSGVRHKDEWQKFLRSDQEFNMEMYNNAVGRQVAIKEKFNPFLTAQGRMPEDGKTLDAVKDWLKEGYEADRARIAQLARDGELTSKQADKELKSLMKDSKQQLNFFDRAYGEITKSDYLSVLGDDGKKAWDRAISTAQAATAASTLGNLLFAQFTDLAIMTFAGTKMGTGFASMFSRMWKRGTFKELAAVDEDLASIIRGGNIQSMGHYIHRMDLDSATADVPGGFLSSTQRVVQSVAVAEGWANLAHVWNRYLRSSFGLDFARQIVKDLDKYDSLGKQVVGFYAKHGVGRQEATDIMAMMKKHSKTVNGITVPDVKKWTTEPGGDRLIRKYKQLVIGAGDEAMLDPGIGDRPFLRRSTGGRLALQFQSFTYKAGNEFFAPLVQSMMINPADVKAMSSIVIGLAFAGTANMARLYASGQGDKADAAMERLENGDSSEYWDLMKSAWLRSPMAVGFSGTAADVLGTTLAPTVNAAWQNSTGTDFKPLNEEWVRLRQNQGVYGLFGPTVGLANTAYKTAVRGLEGDVEHVGEMAAKRLPILNVMPLHVLALTLKKAFGDD